MILEKLSALGPEIKQAIVGILGLLPAAGLARLLYHYRLVRAGHRRFWSRDLLWELPTALFVAILAGGIVAHFGLGVAEGSAIAGVCGWLGPHGLEVLLGRLIDRYGDKGPPS